VFSKKFNSTKNWLQIILLLQIVFLQQVTADQPVAEDGDQAQPADRQTTSKAPPETKQEETQHERELKEMMSVVQEFEQQNKSYKAEVQLIIERKYEEQKKATVGSYERAMLDLEKEESIRRDSAIDVFVKFLAKYPNDASYTPSALWRLAELYYEKSKLTLANEEEEYEKALMRFNREEIDREPTPPTPHFEETVGTLQRLIQDFSSYHLADGAYYLLAFCLQEQGEADEAQDTYRAFVEKYPKSKLVPEVWTRLGNSYFEDPDKLDKAIDAYKNVLRFPESKMYDKALYKLAWTFYKVDMFQDAVERFDQLITWADQDTGEGVDVSRKDLRKESLQYLAISFAEDEWSGSGIDNASAFFRRLGGRKYDGEFFRKLGEVYYIDAKYEKSIAAYQEAIKLYPLAPDNPQIMSTIIDAYYRLQQPEQATEAQTQFVKIFGPESKWRDANKDKVDVIVEADKLAENALYTSAVRHHTLAQRFKEREQPQEAQLEYHKAAEIYKEYLDRFPNSRDSYRLEYYLAESYYYSLNFTKAAEIYEKVRDSVAGSAHLADSANSVVRSYINMAKEQEQQGKLDPLVIYTSKTRPKDLKIAERPVPEIRKKLIEACDKYVEKLPNDEHVGSMNFMAARILYAYDHFDNARDRFAHIVAVENKNDLVTSSINLIVESYLVTKDWEQVESWSRKLASLSRDPTQKQALKEFELGARFRKAEKLMKAGKSFIDEGAQDEAQKKLDAAAAEFVRLVDDDPKGKNSDKALNNAAACYTWSNRPLSAGKIYERIVKEYSQSDFADQALFLMAGSAEGSYQYQRAIDNYMRLVDDYKDSKFRADSLYNAALALEGDQQYLKAARAYERYAKLFPKRDDAAENFYRAGIVLEKEKAWNKVISLFGRFVRTYRKNAKQREKIVMAQLKIAQARRQKGDEKLARKGFVETIKLYKKYNLEAGGKAAEAAAHASFNMADFALKTYEKITFAVPPKRLKKTLKKKAEFLKNMEQKYQEVFSYKRVQWTLAAYYRLGYLYENFAQVLVEAPCPRGLNEEECDLYKGKLMDFSEAPIRKAVSAFELTMEKSKQFKFVNEWTKMAYRSLNKFEPLQYPLQKEPEAALVVDRHGPMPMLRIVESGVKPSGK
jgi:TolA-binding protein